MTITFADGTRMDVAAAAFDDFIKHDLKWVEVVHGRATVKKPSRDQMIASTHTQKMDPCFKRSQQCC